MRREFWWTLLVAGVVGLVAANRVALRYWDYGAASDELPDAVRAYLAAGLPWTVADVASPPVPEARNAAPLVRAAMAAIPKSKALYDFGEDRFAGKRVAPPAELDATLRLTHLAAQKPQLDFDRDWDQGPNITFTEPSRIKDFCRLFVGRAEWRAARGDDAGALSDLEDVRRLAALVGQSPSVTEALVDDACDALATTSAVACLTIAGQDPVRLDRYRAWLTTPAPEPDLRRAFRGEIYTRVVTCRNMDRLGVGHGIMPDSDFEPSRGDKTDSATVPGQSVMRRNGLPENTRSRAYMARCLQAWTELARRTQGLADSPNAIARAAAVIEAHEADSPGLSHAFDALIFPIFSRFWRSNRVLEAHRAVALAFADALILHARTGRWPTSCPLPDPLDEGTLRVRHDGGRFRVWSVGPDGKDDDGLTSAEAYTVEKRSDDVIAAYPPVPREIPLAKSSRTPIGFGD